MPSLADASRDVSFQPADRAVAAVGVLNASIAHQVRNPVASIANRGPRLQVRRSVPDARSERPSCCARTTTPIVFLVTDDESVRRSLQLVIAMSGFAVESCRSRAECLSLSLPEAPCCLLLDISVPTTNDCDVAHRTGTQANRPTIVITDRSDVRATVRAMKAGAIDVLGKPVSSAELSSAVETAIEASRVALRRDAAMREVRDCYASLTPREREVTRLVVSGLLNKQVAFTLGINEGTVKAHRGQVMRKMKAESLPHLVRMAARLDVVPDGHPAEFR
jgi:FixJ family two-component response regulator